MNASDIPKILKGRVGIYKWTIGPHSYVGSSIDLRHRLLRHLADLKRNGHENDYFQRAFNKYSIRKLRFTILEICNSNIEYIDLLKKEKFHIENENTDLNLKRDPVTQQGCYTTTKTVYQYDKFGNFVKEWVSISEAARYYNMNPSNIIVCCKNPKRQRESAGYLWSYENPYPFEVYLYYVFDLDGNYLSTHYDFVGIYEKYFSTANRKSVLSVLYTKVDTNSAYKDIYISSTLDFKIPKKRLYSDKKNYELYSYLIKYDPIITVYNEKEEIRTSQKYSDYKRKGLAKFISNGNYNIDENGNINYYINNSKKAKSISVKNLETNEYKEYSSFTKAIIDICEKFDGNFYKNACKHKKRGTPYKGYLFRDL